MKKTIKCADCKEEFEIDSAKSRYKRKYCKKCSKQRKKDYENLWQVKAKDCDD